MAIFRQYNIQLLPLDGRRTKEVGIEGYRKLFEFLSEETSAAYKNRLMDKQAMPLANDSFICPFVIHPDKDFAYGSFVKYHKADTVTELYTQERLFEAPAGATAISNSIYFKFVFDYDYHILGIEENSNKLPATSITQQTLELFLSPIANKSFPDHTLKINLISDPESLENALKKGNEFGVVEIKLTFPNSHRLNSQLRELRDLNAHNVNVHLAPERGSRMPGIPEYIKKLLQAAPYFGSAKVTFFTKVSRSSANFVKRIYSTQDTPLRLNLRQKKNETDQSFVQRAWMNLRNLAQKR